LKEKEGEFRQDGRFGALEGGGWILSIVACNHPSQARRVNRCADGFATHSCWALCVRLESLTYECVAKPCAVCRLLRVGASTTVAFARSRIRENAGCGTKCRGVPAFSRMRLRANATVVDAPTLTASLGFPAILQILRFTKCIILRALGIHGKTEP